MANSAAGGASDYNTGIIKEFRANQVRVGGMWEGTTLILIHHIGARSGIERVTPVAYHPQPGGRFAIWAANGGSPTHREIERLLALGARRVDIGQTGEESWTVLADPEGNEFCVIRPKETLTR